MALKQRIKTYIHFLGTACTFLSVQAVAQEHYPFQSVPGKLMVADELWGQNLYVNAQQQSLRYVQQKVGAYEWPVTLEQTRVQYITSASNLQLERPGALQEAMSLYQRTFESPVKERLAFSIARHFFYHGQYDKAVAWYENAGIENLSNDEIAESKFEQAYAYLLNKEFDKAENMLGNMRNTEGKYKPDAQYYYGLLSYNRGNYDFALSSFETIKDHATYRNIVPYYIAEIQYFKGEKDQALLLAEELIKRDPPLYFQKELNLLAGQILFEEQEYSRALPYFNYYYDNADRIRKDHIYEIGYANYQLGNYNEAIEKFQLLHNLNDSLGQSSMYLLGNAYLKTGQKSSAKNAFTSAGAMNFNSAQQESALFTSGKLAYELGIYNEAESSFTSLMELYPNTGYDAEVKTISSDILARTNNYEGAYAMISNVASSDPTFLQIKQRILYGLGMQKLIDKDGTAETYLTQAAQMNSDHQYNAAANFWLGEIAYSQQNYEAAIRHHESFIAQNNGSKNQYSDEATLGNSYTTLGYANMQLKDYNKAQQYYAQAKRNVTTVSSGQQATIREADAAFMKKDYNQSLALYDTVIKQKQPESDYALLQKAVIYGVQNKTQDQINALNQIINKTPASTYQMDARYELANVHIVHDQYNPAITQLNAIIKGNSALSSKAYLKKGFAYEQLNKDDDAIAAYKSLLSNYPQSDERMAALDALKSIYIERNQPQEWAKLAKGSDGSLVENAAMDTLYYQSAVNQYAKGNYKTALESFDAYLKQFPNGSAALKAHYYAGESAQQTNQYAAALTHYDWLLNQPTHEFSESAAVKAAQIAALQKDNQKLMQYQQKVIATTENEAKRTEAFYSLMQLSDQQKQTQQAAQYADSLLLHQKATPEQLLVAQYYRANLLLEQKQLDQALGLYQLTDTAKDATVAAASTYQIGNILFQQKKIKEAEEHAGGSLKKLSGQDYWMVKTYLLLADILTEQKDWFNAKATLQSVMKNSKHPDLKKEATEKLEKVNQLEKEKSKLAD